MRWIGRRVQEKGEREFTLKCLVTINTKGINLKMPQYGMEPIITQCRSNSTTSLVRKCTYFVGKYKLFLFIS